MTAATTTTPLHRRRYSSSDPSRRTIGWAAVILVHVFVAWALVSGTARRGLEIIKKPLEAVVIQEVIIPPPPPPPPPKEIKPPEPKQPKVEAPPPPYVPPPEVTPPPSAAPAIQSVQTPPPAPVVIAPPPPPAPPPAAPTGRQEIGVACPTQVKPEMSRQAIKDGAEGVVKAQVLIRDGAVKEVTILSGPRIFHSSVRNAMLQYKCVSGSGDILATQEFVFKIE
ncbi:MAG: energy transducer TonB [Ramlibacter sp.]